MGADFLFVTTEWIPDGYVTDEKIRKALAEPYKISRDGNSWEVAGTHGDLISEVAWVDPDSYETAEEFVDDLVNVVRVAYDYLAEEPRDLGWLSTYNSNGERINLWISGGMSGGDDPTDAFSNITILEHMPNGWWK